MQSPPHTHDVVRLRLESERRLAVLTTSFIFIPNALAGVADHVISANPGQAFQLYAIRLAMFAVWALGLVLLYRAPTHTALRQVNFGLAMALVLFMLAVQGVRPDDHGLAHRSALLATFVIFCAYPNRASLQVVPWLMLAAGTMFIAVQTHALAWRVDYVGLLVQFVLAGTLGAVVATNRRSLERDLSESLDRERAAIEDRERAVRDLRTLEGILPICSHCHKIRTEVGDWQGLDLYVRSRTATEFSHGICPECAVEHYPDLIEGAGGHIS